jgi:radical SAM protein with 4Fe4S-binding SPASM domain
VFKSLTPGLFCITKGTLVFLWNRFTGDSLVLTQDLTDDYFSGKTVSERYIHKIQELDSGVCISPDDICIEAISVHFDSNPCDNSCNYCIKPIKRCHKKRLSHKNIVSFIKRNFPAIKAINVSGPDNHEKYTFVKYVVTQLAIKVSVNINITQIAQICNIPQIDILAGGSLEDFLRVPKKHLQGLNAYIVLHGRYCDYNRMLNLIPDLSLRTLTIEYDLLDTDIDIKRYCDFLVKLQKLCSFDVSGSWEKPVLNINKKIMGPCNSFAGRSLSIHDTGYISVCGYVDDSSLRIEKTLFGKDSFAPLVLDYKYVGLCRRCPILGMCKGGCHILHSKEYKRAFNKQCEIKKAYFEKWIKGYLAEKQNN